MKQKLLVTAAVIGFAQQLSAQSAPMTADMPFEFEQPGMITEIAPGPNVYVLDQNWGGSSQVQIYDANDLSTKGIVSGGIQANYALSPDGSKIYMVGGYYSRINWGDGENVVEVFDAKTLERLYEIAIPLKAAQYTADASLMRVSADGKFAYVQNSTPATSVSVVNLETREFVEEIPLPGCFGIYPALEGHKFSALCATGAFQTITLDAEGHLLDSKRGEPVFDPNEDPIQMAMDRYDGDMFFVSNGGSLLRVTDTGETVTAVSTVAMTDGYDGWVPGGYSLFSINEAHGVAFVAMHEAHAAGTHHESSTEIWAFDIDAGELLYRSTAEAISSLTVTDGEDPVIYGVSLMNGSLEQFAVDPTARFAVKHIGSRGGIGFSTVLETRAE